MSSANQNKKGRPLELVFLFFFAAMFIIEIKYPPWNYYDLTHAAKKIPLFFGFFAYLNYNIYLYIGIPGLVLSLLLVMACFMLLRGKDEKLVYRFTVVCITILMLYSIGLAYIDSLFMDNKSLVGGKLGLLVVRALPGGIWRWLFMFAVMFTGTAIFFNYFLKKNLFQIIWEGLRKMSLAFEAKKQAMRNKRKTAPKTPKKPLKPPPVPPPQPPVDTGVKGGEQGQKPTIVEKKGDEAGTVRKGKRKIIIEIDEDSDADDNGVRVERPLPPTKPEPVDSDYDKSSDKKKGIKKGSEIEKVKLDLSPLYIEGPSPSSEVMGNLPTMPPTEQEDLDETAGYIEDKFRELGVALRIEPLGSGPFLSLYTIKPKTGVKVSQIMALDEDISIALERGPVRFDTSGEIGYPLVCEVPLKEHSTVYYRDILSHWSKERLADPCFVAGVNVMGAPVGVSFHSLPHLLVAGATGSGKSVFLNMVISHLTLSYSPSELRMVLMDAKQLELTPFNPLKHLACPVVTDVRRAERILERLIEAMDERYGFLKDKEYRSLAEYLEGCSESGERPELCYVVVVIDELADFMMTGGKVFMELVVRLAQKSRAVGIHLVVATQRPSVDIISGSVKANFSGRASFKVATGVDSRVILDSSGAEKLLGKGDMLFYMPGSQPRRLHGGMMTTSEIKSYTKWWEENY